MSRTRVMKSRAAVAALALSILLSGCARGGGIAIHTLVNSQANEPGVGDFAYQLERVDVPPAVDQRTLVLRDERNRVYRVDNQQWSAPLPEELRAALMADLGRELGASEVSAVAPRDGMPIYRLSVDVQRFDAWLSRRVVVAAVWSVRLIDADKTGDIVWTCASRVERDTDAGIDALVATAQQAVAGLAAQMAALIIDSRENPKIATCPT